MPTECSAERFDFGIVEGRAVEAAFDAGLVTSDAGALLLGATDRAIVEVTLGEAYLVVSPSGARDPAVPGRELGARYGVLVTPRDAHFLRVLSARKPQLVHHSPFAVVLLADVIGIHGDRGAHIVAAVLRARLAHERDQRARHQASATPPLRAMLQASNL